MAKKSIPHHLSRRNDLTADYVRSILDYNPLTGEFRWRIRPDVKKPKWWKTKFAGRLAGSPDTFGHNQIRINNVKYSANRLAWLIMTGEWPIHLIDHENRDPGDDRWNNLRLATFPQNCQNQRAKPNRSGFRGVSKSGNKWHSYITADNRRFYLGVFSTPEEAYAAYCKAAIELHRDFASIELQRASPGVKGGE